MGQKPKLRVLPTIFFLPFFLISCVSHSASPWEPGGYRIVREKLHAEGACAGLKEDRLPEYSFLEIRNTRHKKIPLLLAMHASGINGHEYLLNWKDEAVKRGVMVVSPHRTHGYKNQNEDMDIFICLVESLTRRYPVDRDRIYLAGVSSGALLARWMMVLNPDYFKKVVFIAGPASELWMNKIPKGIELPPILYVHGEKDSAFPIAGARENVERLKRIGADVELHKKPNAGHTHLPEWNSDIFDWMLRDEGV